MQSEFDKLEEAIGSSNLARVREIIATNENLLRQVNPNGATPLLLSIEMLTKYEINHTEVEIFRTILENPNTDVNFVFAQTGLPAVAYAIPTISAVYYILKDGRMSEKTRDDVVSALKEKIRTYRAKMEIPGSDPELIDAIRYSNRIMELLKLYNPPKTTGTYLSPGKLRTIPTGPGMGGKKKTKKSSSHRRSKKKRM